VKLVSFFALMIRLDHLTAWKKAEYVFLIN
jgi:hypothetical protein